MATEKDNKRASNNTQTQRAVENLKARVVGRQGQLLTGMPMTLRTESSARDVSALAKALTAKG